MAYTKTVWTDRDVEHPNRYKDQNNNQLILTRDEGTVTEAGTFLNSTVMNNIEDGIEALDTAVSTLELDKISNDGWSSANETWAYSSVDDPTGVITISGDKTTKYSVGMRIKFTNGGNVIYGIITAISYSSPNTILTFLHEIDPTDSLALHLMANSAITANYYSSMKAPYGFPMNPSKWSISYSFATMTGQTSPTQYTWYNNGSSYIVPIGCWNTLIKTISNIERSTTDWISNEISFATVNNNGGEAYLTVKWALRGPSMGDQRTNIIQGPITVITPTTYYLNQRTINAGCSLLRLQQDNAPTTVILTCAYL